MKKVLIYQSINTLKPVGGPAGYLYNLKNALNEEECDISFLPEINEKDNNKLKTYIPKRISSFLRAYKYTKLLDASYYLGDEYKKYDIIHFHQTLDMYKCRDFLKTYKGIVLLTSHSPCVYHKELVSKLNKKDYRFFKKKLDKLEKIDEYAFRRANYIIFPCKEAEEPYYNSWENYNSIRDENKLRYLYTGIKQCVANMPPKSVRSKYGYTDDDFIVSYVGRHNEIKGYDQLVKIGLQAIEQANIKMLVAGKNEPIKGPEIDNWIEIGWTDDPHSVINASNLFLLPNKETYFDLIALEVLSLGKIILTTYTGGNKIFSNFDNIGVFYYKDENDCIAKIKYIKSLSKEEIERLEKRNKQIFDTFFTSEIFAKNYIKLIESF